jgi:hypothetical protein
MQIQIEPHTLKRAEERGANESEILDVISTGINITAKLNRLAKAKVFEFHELRNNKFYEQKRIEVIYTIENDTFVTITVYVFYGKWE